MHFGKIGIRMEYNYIMAKIKIGVVGYSQQNFDTETAAFHIKNGINYCWSRKIGYLGSR